MKIIQRCHQALFIGAFLFILFFQSCSSFSTISGKTEYETRDGYVIVSNKSAGLVSKTYGDFKFARNSKEFRELNDGKKPKFRNILIYAKTYEPPYEYYILKNTNSVNTLEGYIRKESGKLVLVISKNAPEADVTFICDNLISHQTR